jgi:hypothetical protein
MKKLLQYAYKRIKRLVLRGPILSFWVKIKVRRWQNQYIRVLTSPVLMKVKTPRNTGKTPLNKDLNRFLIICNEMWEKEDLVPEINTIVKTQLLDIKTVLNEGQIDQDKFEKAVCEMTAGTKFDAALIYLNNRWLSDDLLSKIREKTIGPLLGMNLDDKAEFFGFGPGEKSDCNYSQWINRFDLNISNCKSFKEHYESLGGNFFYSPQGVHIPIGLEAPKEGAFNRKIAFLGSAKEERVRLIQALSKKGVYVDTFGKGWPKQQWIDNTRDVFRSTQLNLGLGFASGSETLTTIKGRDFECPGVGACYLTTYNFELCEHWDLGTEILCYRTIEELIEMVTFYEKKPEACLKIARAAFERAKKEHTWAHRFKKIFKTLDFDV